MTIDREKLKALAEAAVPGPWECREAEGSSAVCWRKGWVADSGTDQDIADNRFIAAASPATILALLAEIERLESRVAILQKYEDECLHLMREAEAERDQLKAENEQLRGAMHRVMEQVDGNIRETVRDCVNGRDDVQDIYGYCDAIELIISAAMAKEAGQ